MIVAISGTMPDTAIADRWTKAAATFGSKALIVVKLKYLVPMTIILMVGYIGLTI